MRLPKINQKVSLRIPRGSWEGLYPTYVEGIGPQALTVAYPTYGGANVPLTIGEEVLLEFIDGGERLAFPTHVTGRYTQVVPILSLALPAPGTIRRHQQRDFVRLEATLPISFAVLPENPDEKGTEKLFLRGRTMDISGNGAQIASAVAYPAGTRLELILELPDGDVRIEALVVRLAQQPTPKEVWLGVRFVRVDDRDRERIIRYIFTEQRSRRQKGLL